MNWETWAGTLAPGSLTLYKNWVGFLTSLSFSFLIYKVGSSMHIFYGLWGNLLDASKHSSNLPVCRKTPIHVCCCQLKTPQMMEGLSTLVVGEAHLGVGYLAMWGKLFAIMSYVNLYQPNIFLYFLTRMLVK